tara:strand:+ start:115 stop:612 length:498 start_codon:yes stop_codon:yes gene_type:complete
MVKSLFLRTIMMGGIDGIITIFNIISGIEGSKLNYKYIFILGIATLLSDAISMGTGEYISVKAEKKYKNLNNTINPFKNGIIMFISFVIFGTIPLCIYFIALKINPKNKYINTYISVLITLFILGIIKSKYTKDTWYISGGYNMVYGGIASMLAFNVSRFISSFI